MFAASKTASVSGGYQISRSLRFNSADSAYLGRTPATASNRKTWTWSGWVKRTKLGVRQGLFTCLSGTGLQFGFLDTDVFQMGTNSVYVLQSTQVFRDPSAWYHVVVSVNTTLASNRCSVYINGTQITAWGLNTFDATIGQNVDTSINLNADHALGQIGTNSSYFDGYMTEVNFIDGQALTPSSFGETNAQTGVWGPKAFSGGAYGTNGFYVNFSDNSNNTAATLGKDYSGNGNNWTPNNFSVTAGAGNDSLVDSPTSYGTDTGVGGTVRGNYATWNPLVVNKPNLTNGNLDADGSDLKTSISTMGVSTGKWYWEITIGSGTNTPNMGVTAYANDNADPGVYLGVGRSYVSGSGNTKAYTATSVTANSAFSNANTAGATIGFALDCDAGTLAYYVNNTLGYTDSTVATGTLLYPMTCNFNSAANNYRNTSVNFGQRPFAYTAPSGFKALCTQNLPTPTIGATTATLATQYFTPTLFTGTGAAGNAVTVGFQPDFTWVKDRVQTGGYHHILQDAVRGANKVLYSNLTNAEVTASGFSFTSTGFTVGTGIGDINVSGSAEVAWNWKANGSGSTNTAGSITSTVSANTTSGFSVVTYTGTGNNATVGHGIGIAPSMVIVKSRSNALAWIVGHASVGFDKYLLLNATDAVATASTVWNSTNPTSTVFSIGTAGGTNTSGATYVAYCFAPIAGYSAFGSFTGNGSTDGPFVYTGFRPAYVMVKKTNSTSDWLLTDGVRSPSNVVNKELNANLSLAEGSGFSFFDYLSNGFKSRGTNPAWNTNGDTYIYMAFAESPFKYALAR